MIGFNMKGLIYFEHMPIILIRATMARPKCCRLIHTEPTVRCFGPKCEDSAGEGAISLSYDELEALRLCDLLKMHHHEAADEMNVSRQTIGRILESAREKTAKAVSEGLSLLVAGGQYSMSLTRSFRCSSCNSKWELPFGGGRPQDCPECKSTNFHREHTVAEPEAALVGGPGKGCCHRGQKGQGHGRRCRGGQA